MQTKMTLENILTIKADDLVRKKKHKDNQKAPTDNFHHPAPMMQAITRILLSFDADHHSSQNSEK